MHLRQSISALGGLAIMALLLSVTMANGAMAQDSAATPMGQAGAVDHPAHIHSGTCAELGEVVYPLADLKAPGMSGTPTTEAQGAMTEASPASDMASGMENGEVVAESTTIVTTSIDELLASPFAINVHESMENIGNYIACGDITAGSESAGDMGSPAAGGRHIEITLHELNNSGVQGQAALTEMGDGTVQVTVQLTQVQNHGMEMGSPVASPTS